MGENTKLFREGDIVRFERYRITKYMEVASVEGKNLCGFILGPGYDFVTVPIAKAALVPPVSVGAERIRQYVRYEITARDFVGEVFPQERLSAVTPYHVTYDDMLTLMTRAELVGRNRFSEEWFDAAGCLDKLTDIGDDGHDDFDTDGYRFLPSEADAVSSAYEHLCAWVSSREKSLEEAVGELRKAEAMRSLPIPERAYSTEVKENYIGHFESDRMLREASECEVGLFRQYVDELCTIGNRAAMHIKAYACYGGNRAYPCDWVTSRHLLLKLLEGNGTEGYANTLGYIYYYGRCTDGVPEYDKAFYYYSIGAAGGCYESRYKLADMFLHGYGVPKSVSIAENVMAGMYLENRAYMMAGEMSCKFADVALRMGRLALETDGDNRFDNAYFFYLQADYAIRMRMKAVDWYGDAKVASSAREAIAEVLPKTSYIKPVRTVYGIYPTGLLRRMMPEGHTLEARFKRLSGGKIHMRVRILPANSDKRPPKLFLTVPEAHFCGMVDSLTLKCENPDTIEVYGKPLTDSAVVCFNQVEDNKLMISGSVQASLGTGWSLTVRKPETESTHRIASVCFGLSDRRYDYLCEDSDVADINPGDRAVVLTSHGETIVTVQDVFTRTESEMPLPLSAYKKLLRKA